MKKIISVILTAAMLLGFAACAPVSKDSIQPAIYKLEDDLFPRIYLREGGEFSIFITGASSIRGTYSVSDGVLKLENEDGAVYCFDIKKDALVFNAELSDEIEKLNESAPEIVDGTKFELWHKANLKSTTAAKAN